MGCVPKSLLIGTMIHMPTVKRQVVCNSNNFRAIALNSIIGKVLDLILFLVAYVHWIILIKDEKSLCRSELQFGFKQGVSTTQCTHVVK